MKPCQRSTSELTLRIFHFLKGEGVGFIESLSMTFTADGKRQRLTLIFCSFLVILK